MALTLDVWQIPPESARRVGHPAPFPVELPEKLIELYTFEDDLVLDPFMGSGSTLVAASRTGRRYVGYDLDPGYVELARARVDDEGDPIAVRRACARPDRRTVCAEVLERRRLHARMARAVRLQGLGLTVHDVVDRRRRRAMGDRGRRTVRALARRADLGRRRVAHARSRPRVARARRARAGADVGAAAPTHRARPWRCEPPGRRRCST